MSTPKPVVVEPLPCPFCKEKVDPWYEGSHDWDFMCSKCSMSKGFYVPHIGDERQEAVNKWNKWASTIRIISTEPSPAPWCAACGTHGHTSGNCPEIKIDKKDNKT